MAQDLEWDLDLVWGWIMVLDLVPDHASHQDPMGHLLALCLDHKMDHSFPQGHHRERISTSTRTSDLLQEEEECLRVHLPCEGHIQVLQDPKCQDLLCQFPRLVPCAPRVLFHQALEETLDLEDHLQSELLIWVQNRDPGLGWDLNQAQDLWAQVVPVLCQALGKVLDKDMVQDLVPATFQKMK